MSGEFLAASLDLNKALIKTVRDLSGLIDSTKAHLGADFRPAIDEMTARVEMMLEASEAAVRFIEGMP